MNIYSETISLCPMCGKDSPAYYEEKHDGMFLNVECIQHGTFSEKVESDSRFFREGYEQEYKKQFDHIFLPITYRCNLRCRYCYSLSNTEFPLPEDRTLAEITGYLRNFLCNVTFSGGEPTLREDLLEVIRIAKETNGLRKVSIATNGQMLRNIKYVEHLKTKGLDFVILSFNDIRYDVSKNVYQNRIEALKNCFRLGMPVWLQRTVDDLSQIDSLLGFVEEYKRVIFNVTVRAVRSFGAYYPVNQIFTSDILKYLENENAYTKGTNPFNRHTNLFGKKFKICFWVNDMARIDPIDSYYLTSNNVITTLHRGMKVDEVLLMNKNPLPRNLVDVS